VVAVSISVTVAVAAGAVVFLLLSDRSEPEASQPQSLSSLLQGIGCSPVQTFPSEGLDHVAEGTAADHDTVPATSGAHAPSSVPPQPPVLTESVTPELETRLVHNLEHAYVLIYYRPDGAGAVPPATVGTLADVARREFKVLLAPHPGLEPRTSVAFVAWTRLVECPNVQDRAALQEAALRFVAAFRGTANAPEPAGP
jgi:Protein of unknown function (DUF3105)